MMAALACSCSTVTAVCAPAWSHAFLFELSLRCYETTQGGHGISLSGPQTSRIPHTRRPRARPTSAGRKGSDSLVFLFPPSRPLQQLPGDYRFAREQDCDLRLFDFEAFGGFGKEVRSTLREAANQLSNKLSHALHLDEVTWTTKNWHGLQMQRLSVVLHTAVAWQTVNELACGDSGIVHGAKCIAVLNGVA